MAERAGGRAEPREGALARTPEAPNAVDGQSSLALNCQARWRYADRTTRSTTILVSGKVAVLLGSLLGARCDAAYARRTARFDLARAFFANYCRKIVVNSARWPPTAIDHEPGASRFSPERPRRLERLTPYLNCK